MSSVKAYLLRGTLASLPVLLYGGQKFLCLKISFFVLINSVVFMTLSLCVLDLNVSFPSPIETDLLYSTRNFHTPRLYSR